MLDVAVCGNEETSWMLDVEEYDYAAPQTAMRGVPAEESETPERVISCTMHPYGHDAAVDLLDDALKLDGSPTKVLLALGVTNTVSICVLTPSLSLSPSPSPLPSARYHV